MGRDGCWLEVVALVVALVTRYQVTRLKRERETERVRERETERESLAGAIQKVFITEASLYFAVEPSYEKPKPGCLAMCTSFALFGPGRVSSSLPLPMTRSRRASSSLPLYMARCSPRQRRRDWALSCWSTSARPSLGSVRGKSCSLPLRFTRATSRAYGRARASVGG